jgi:hypothetical protein
VARTERIALSSGQNGWVSRPEHVKAIAREGLRAAGLNCAFEVPKLIPNSDRRPGDLFACLEAPYPSAPVPRNTSMDVTIRSSRVAARWRPAAEKHGGSATFAEQEKRNDLSKAIAAAAAAAHSPLSRIYHGNSSHCFDQYGAPGESTLDVSTLT